MDTQTTTDLETIRKQPHRFTWGTIKTISSIGSYTIVEYEDRACPRIRRFYPYFNEKELNSSMDTFDAALLFAVAHRNLGPDEARYMAMAAAKLLGVAT